MPVRRHHNCDIGAANHRCVVRRAIMELEDSFGAAASSFRSNGTFANHRNQYVPAGNITAMPSNQAARAAA